MAQLNDLIVTGKSRFLNDISGNITGTSSNVTGTVEIANGGTGATTAANARTNLGLGSAAVKAATDSYSATGTDVTTGKAVAAALGTLDGTISGSAAASKTLTAFSQTDGKVSATFGNISITKSQVSDFPTSMTPSSHTHGNIQNGGTLQTSDITIASGDKLVVTDSSDSSKIARASISFDGSTTTKCLTQKGTWETFGTSNLAIGTTSSTAAAGNHTHSAATTAANGFMTTAQVTKLNGIEAGAQVNTVTSVAGKTGAITLSASDVGALASTTKYAGASTAGGAATSLSNFKVTTTTNLGIDAPGTNCIGYVSGLTKAAWNSQQTDGALYEQFYNASWQHQIFGDYRTGQIAVRGKNNGTWTDWKSIGMFTATPTTGQVVITDGTSGGIKSSGYTIATSVPSGAVFTDTKNTAGSTDTSSKIFLIGATSQAANPQTYSHDTAYIGTDGCLYSGGTKVLTAHQDISGKLDKSGGTMTGKLTLSKAYNQIITGSGTAASDKGSGVSPRYFPAKWTFNLGANAANGDIITIKIPVAGHSYGVYVSVDNGTNYYPVATNSTSRLTTHYGNGTYIQLVFESSGSVASIYPVAGGDATTTITGGCWRVINYYDSNSDTIPSAYCSTAEGTAAKTASCTNYSLLSKSYLHVLIRYANTSASALTFNVNSKGAKPIYINGSASSSSNYTLPAGSYLVYYDGTNYYFRTDGMITGDITGNAATATTASKLSNTSKIGDTNKPVYFTADGVPAAISYTIKKSVPSDAVFTDTNNAVTQTATTTDANYEVLFSATADNTTRTEGTRKTTTLRFNPSKGALMEGTGTTASGNDSHAEGYKTCASGLCSHVEGYASTARGEAAHAEGFNTYARGDDSHAEGNITTASGDYSHAEGYNTIANGSYAHAEGQSTTAKGGPSHAEGYGTYAGGEYGSHAEGSGTSASGSYSHAEGMDTYATGASAHAEGSVTTASGNYAHAEGASTYATGASAHAEGSATIASGNYAHAEGLSTCASGAYSHAEGTSSTATTYAAHAGGSHTTASNFASFSTGHYNAAMTTGGNATNTTGTAFVIGNGTSSTFKNAFSVQYNGVVKAASTITASTTADYAEFFEWVDENPDEEDRVGYFVTTSDGDNTKIRIANSNDEYILGIVSGEPFVLGNGDCDVWNGIVLRDNFGRVIYEPAQKYELNPETGKEEPVYDEEGNPVYEGTKPKYNPNYDPSQPYISRLDRPEWAPIGMLGVLYTRDDGTCIPGKYCTVNTDGIATYIERYDRNSNCYKVIERVTENIIKVIFR